VTSFLNVKFQSKVVNAYPYETVEHEQTWFGKQSLTFLFLTDPIVGGEPMAAIDSFLGGELMAAIDLA
jgi:hypothetical protein